MSTADRAPTADEIISQMGEDFAFLVKKDRRQAFQKMRDTLMMNLPVIAKSGLAPAVHEMVALAMDIDKAILGGSAQGSTTEPLDKFIDRWTLKDEGDEGYDPDKDVMRDKGMHGSSTETEE